MSPGSPEREVLRAGPVAPELRAEFPGLRLVWLPVPGRAAPSPPGLRRRLRALSDRYRGPSVVTMRVKAVPHAYRAFYRQIGLDPDVQRIPGEAAAVDRLLHGEFRSVDRISDACLVALVETGVPVWAVDGAAVDEAGLCVRTAVAGDAGAGVAAAAGSLVVADGRRAQAVLFSDPPADRRPGPRTRRIVLFALGVDGVPEIHVEEALWLAADLVVDREGGGEPESGW